MEQKYGVVTVRGLINTSKATKDTLKMLNIGKRNACAIVEGTRSMIGMMNKVKNYVTFGEVNEETIKLLKAKRGDGDHYNLNSPKKGYGRKGIKTNFSNGGALGYRGDKMNDLIRRMI